MHPRGGIELRVGLVQYRADGLRAEDPLKLGLQVSGSAVEEFSDVWVGQPVFLGVVVG